MSLYKTLSSMQQTLLQAETEAARLRKRLAESELERGKLAERVRCLTVENEMLSECANVRMGECVGCDGRPAQG